MTTPGVDAAGRAMGNPTALHQTPPSVVFLADLHLGSTEEARHRTFRDYLLSLRELTPPPWVVILGDLFDYWAGPSSESDPGHAMALRTLRELTDSGVTVTLLTGNRDFLLDGRVGALCGTSVEQRGFGVQLGGQRVFVCHGDLLLTDDRAHLRFRWIIRSFWVRFLADVMPRALVRFIASRIRRASASRTERKAARVFEIPPPAAARIFRGGYDVIICGHVHAQARREMIVDGKPRTLFTLGAWEDEASILVFDDAGFRFVGFPLETETSRS